MCFTPVIPEAPIENGFEYKGPLIHVKVPLSVVQPDVQYQNPGCHPGMPLAYPGVLSSTTVVPQYAYIRVPYVPFGVHYDQISNCIVNPGLVHSAQMIPPVATPQVHPQLQLPLVPMPCYSFLHGVTSQYQPPQAQILRSQQTVPHNHPGQGQTKRYENKHSQRDHIPMTYAQLLPHLVQQ